MEWNFQKIVLAIAIILLIMELIFIGIALAKSKSKQVWPPIIGGCPDYWVDLSVTGAKCLNKLSLGTCNIPTSNNPNEMDFTGSTFSGSNSSCSKFIWSKGCGVTWDGITSGVVNPCITTANNKK